jgi:hypothetical protein
VKGCVVFRVINRGEVFGIMWVCAICEEPFRRLNDIWLGFPPTECAEGRLIHRDCLNGQVETTFGMKRVALIYGEDAIRQVAKHLDEAADVSLLKRRHGARALSPHGESVPGIQRRAVKRLHQ